MKSSRKQTFHRNIIKPPHNKSIPQLKLLINSNRLSSKVYVLESFQEHRLNYKNPRNVVPCSWLHIPFCWKELIPTPKTKKNKNNEMSKPKMLFSFEDIPFLKKKSNVICFWGMDWGFSFNILLGKTGRMTDDRRWTMSSSRQPRTMDNISCVCFDDIFRTANFPKVRRFDKCSFT